MKKARVQDFYEIDDQGYLSTCTVIGLKNPATLTGEQLDYFDTVRSWLDNKEVKNFKAAQERFRLEQEKESETREKIIEALETLDPIIKERANICLEELLSKVGSHEAELLQVALDAVSEHLGKLQNETKGC
jgi:restriction endonuclease Mrr